MEDLADEIAYELISLAERLQKGHSVDSILNQLEDLTDRWSERWEELTDKEDED